MALCVYSMFEDCLLVVSEIDDALSTCNPSEPLAVTDCIDEVRAYMLALDRKFRAYEREEVVNDDDG